MIKLISITLLLILVIIILEFKSKETFETVGEEDKCPKNIIYFDTDIPGHNMYYMPKRDETEDKCKDFCEEKGCHWYNYNSKTHKCWIKQGKPKNGYITGFKIPEGTDETCGKYHYIENIDIPGHGSVKAPFLNVTEKECRDKCDLHICDWYNYDKTKRKCWLKKKHPKANLKTVINLI